MGKLLTGLGVFVLGFLLASVFFLDYGEEKRPFSFLSNERASPGDWLQEKEIKVMMDKVVIDREGVILSSFADTNSMDPFLDAEANGLEIRPEKGRLGVGDIISYRSKVFGGVVIHRITEIGEDDSGFYYLVQGDNNSFRDPEKVRFEQIEGVLIGILY